MLLLQPQAATAESQQEVKAVGVLCHLACMCTSIGLLFVIVLRWVGYTAGAGMAEFPSTVAMSQTAIQISPNYGNTRVVLVSSVGQRAVGWYVSSMLGHPGSLRFDFVVLRMRSLGTGCGFSFTAAKATTAAQAHSR